MDSGKKRFDPRSIDEKAILDIVARKGTIRPDSPATSASPKPEDTVEEIAGSSEAPVFTTGEIDAYRASFLNTVRTKSRKSLHIDAGLHRRISSLVWAVGRGEVTVAGFVNQVLAHHFEENGGLINAVLEKEYLFIILFIYASYLSIEKYVHTGSIFTWRGRKDRKERRATPVTIHPAASSSETEIIGKSRYQIRQSLTIDDNSGQPESGIEKSDTFTPEKKTEPVLRVREPLDKNTKFPEVPAPFQKLNYPEIDYMREASPSSGEEKEEIPERYEITGYVQRSNPHRATGVTFDDMDMIEKAMASDELTEAEQEQARQTFQKLEGTNMERVLQASVLGSSDKLKRYMRLYVDRGEPHLLTGKNRDDILREFDIREHVPE